MQTNTHIQTQSDGVINNQKSVLKIRKYQFDDLDEIDQSQEEFMARKSQSRSIEGKSKQDSSLIEESIINPQKELKKYKTMNSLSTYIPIQQLSFQDYWNMKYTHQQAQTAAVESIHILKSKSIQLYLQHLVTTKQPNQDNWSSLNPLTDVASLQTKQALLKQMKNSLHQEIISKQSDEAKLQKCIKKINSNPKSRNFGVAQEQKQGFIPWNDQAYMNQWKEEIANLNMEQTEQDREIFQKRKAYEGFKGKHTTNRQHQNKQAEPKIKVDNNNNNYNPQGSFDQFFFPQSNFQVKTQQSNNNTPNFNQKSQNHPHLRHLTHHKSHKYYKSRARQKRLQIKSRFRPSQNQTQQNQIKLCEHVFKETIGNMLELLGEQFYTHYQTPQSFKFELAQTLDKAKREDSRFDLNLRTKHQGDDQFNDILQMTSLQKVPFKSKKSSKKQQKAAKKQRKLKGSKKIQKQIKQQVQKIEQPQPVQYNNQEQNIEVYFNQNSFHNLMQFSREGISNHSSNPFLNSRQNQGGIHGFSFFSDTSREDKQKNTEIGKNQANTDKQCQKPLQLIQHQQHDRSINISNQLGLVFSGNFFDQDDQLKIF